MIYPSFIKEKEYIGVCAPSNGITNEIKQKRVDNAYKKLNEYGFKTKETASVRNNLNGKSNTSEIIAEEIDSLITNNEIKWIICATGGDFIMEILPYINYNNICKNPKWIQGYSDITALIYTITTNYDIATIYGYNIGSFGMNNWHQSIIDNIELISGTNNTQFSYDYYENEFHKYITGYEEFHKDEKVCWKEINDRNNFEIQGRIIGGCIDVIKTLIGTKYDKTSDFINKYKDDGIIWYFDNYDLNVESLINALLQLKYCGYFNYTKGIIFGRSVTETSFYNIPFKEGLKRALNDLNIPVIYDADIGHKHPEMSIINGSIATIFYNDNKGKIIQKLL